MGRLDVSREDRALPPSPISAVNASMVAAGQRVTARPTGGNFERASVAPSQEPVNKGGVKDPAWGREAWDHYRSNGELGYLIDQTARVGSKATMRLLKSSELPGEDPEPLDRDHPSDMLAASLVARFGGTEVGRRLLFQRALKIMGVSGRVYLVGTNPNRGDSGPASREIAVDALHWEALSSSEVRQVGEGWEIGKGGAKRVYTDAQAWVINVWDPDLEDSRVPTSQVLRNLPVLRELDGLTRSVAAVIDSQLAGGGILLVPSEVTFPNNPESPQAGLDQFMLELYEAMTTAIADRSSPEALAPIMLRVPAEHINAFRHMKFSQELAEVFKILRDEAIRRLALGMDAPPDILLDSSGNHWATWSNSISFVTDHVEPALVIITDAVTTQFIQPVMKAAKTADWWRYILVPDVEGLTAAPSREDNATAAYDRLVINSEALRRELGFDEGDAPSVEEMAAQMLKLIGRLPAGALEVAPMLLRLLGREDIAGDVERLGSYFGGVTEEDILIQTGKAKSTDQRVSENSNPGDAPPASDPKAPPGSRPEGRPANDPGAP